uniref:FUS-interacting serine-arginine-rich protein 1 n=1 Tax=Rhipicephalus appendiculatus TaxID=34631 RepID=A0A131Z4B2_RHIAP
MSSRYSRPPNSSLFIRNVPDGTRRSRYQVCQVKLTNKDLQDHLARWRGRRHTSAYRTAGKNKLCFRVVCMKIWCARARKSQARVSSILQRHKRRKISQRHKRRKV